ncbi:MAG: hypothetical protein MUO21_00010 [Nitrososphaeraceae archaeon]|nr:hypothetical protein [Nitrososphaeraceae archaeon]
MLSRKIDYLRERLLDFFEAFLEAFLDERLRFPPFWDFLEPLLDFLDPFLDERLRFPPFWDFLDERLRLDFLEAFLDDRRRLPPVILSTALLDPLRDALDFLDRRLAPPTVAA